MPKKRLPAEDLKLILRGHILQAIGDLSTGVKHAFADSTGFDLVHEGKHYPPKAVFGVAGRYALGFELLPEHFSGGEDSTCFQILRREGFAVVPKQRAFLLTWNPEHFPAAAFRQELKDFESGKATSLRWSVGHRKDLPVGSTLFLMRLGAEPKGIVGKAISIGVVEENQHWKMAKADQGVKALYVTCKPIHMQEEPFLPLALLKEEWPAFDWTPQSSGVEIHDAALISFLGGDLLNDAGIQLPNEVAPEEEHIEGAISQILVNAYLYERDPKARKKCLQHHGTRCAACGKTMEEVYGSVGKDIIHIHHRRPLHTIGEAYKVDPIHDLVPVCPNCHAVLHKENPAMKVEKLRGLLGSQ